MRWRPLALVAAIALAGALGTLAIGAIGGMGQGDLGHLALLLIPAVALTVSATAVARPLLAPASMRARFLATAIVAVLIAVVNLVVLAEAMFVSVHDAGLLAILLFYSLGAGIGVALTLSRTSTRAVGRLGAAADALGSGQLDARVGALHAGPELDALGTTLDRMADRLQSSIAKTEAAEATRRDLITAVSHDLRTPLAGVRAMVEAVDDGVVDDEPTIRRYAAEMRRSVESLTLLVDDLFELVQLDAGAIEAETERARVEDIVRSAVRACETQALEKSLVLETRIEAGDCLASPRVTRVLQNLLQNAIRHTPADGTVVMEARSEADRLELVVSDTGEGIEPDALERVFEPFWRGDAARHSEGSGLGLALARRIVEGLGGQIRVRSEPQRGSSFAVILPQS